MYDYQMFLDYVHKRLVDSVRDFSGKHPFRSRYKHTLRVLKWAERLSEGRDDVDKDVLFIAAIFHDSGYATSASNDHQTESAVIFHEYAKTANLPKELVEKAAICIETHSKKWLLADYEKLLIEQVLLMEADLLDEEGALAICWDGLSTRYADINSYEGSLKLTLHEFEKKLGSNPMVTPLAREVWDKKQKFVKQYVEELEYDLTE